jgi:hypothetical protein
VIQDNLLTAYRRQRNTFGGDDMNITLIEWFAAHAPQPGQDEIVSVAGVKLRPEKMPAELTEEEKTLPTWREWWRSLTNAERYDLYAKCNYAYAKAMIENDETAKPKGLRGEQV